MASKVVAPAPTRTSKQPIVKKAESENTDNSTSKEEKVVKKRSATEVQVTVRTSRSATAASGVKQGVFSSSLMLGLAVEELLAKADSEDLGGDLEITFPLPRRLVSSASEDWQR